MLYPLTKGEGHLKAPNLIECKLYSYLTSHTKLQSESIKMQHFSMVHCFKIRG